MDSQPLIRSKLFGILIILLLAFSGCNNNNDKPNILFILIDDLGKEWISTYGAMDVKTPVIDSLASGGMLFNNAYSMPQCTPTRVALLTGQYPWRNGWVNHYDVPRWGHGGRFDPGSNPSFAKNLRDAGYATCIAGKWQINDFRLEPEATVLAGFDEYCMWTGGEGGGASQEASQQRYWDPYIHTKEGSRTYPGEFGPDIYTDFIIDFMKRNKEKPMLIYFPMCLTHGPLTTTPAWPDAPREKQHVAMVEYTDLLLGKLLNTLDELGIRDKTLTIWTTDNGTSQGFIGRMNDRYVRGGKTKTTENGINAPFIANWPGTIAPGITTDALVDFTDILPTFCELAGAKTDPEYIYDGLSFAPLLLGQKDDSGRETILAMGGHFAVLENDRIKSTHDFRDRVIRDKNFKAYIDTNGQIAEIIDLRHDPEELFNLIHSQDEDVISAREKFHKELDKMPMEDASPVYTRIDAPYYNHPAEDLNKISLRSKKISPKSKPVSEAEYMEYNGMEKPLKVKIAMAQIYCRDGDREGNYSRIESALIEAVDQGAEIVCYPETSILGWVNPDAHDRAYPIPGKDSEFICSLAKKHNVFICIGMAEKNGKDLHDSMILVDNLGNIILKHRKINIVTELMDPPYTPGTEVKTVNTRFGYVGLLICADSFKKELLDDMSKLKPNLLLIPYGWAAEEEAWPEHSNALKGTIQNAARTVGCTVVGTDLIGQISNGPWKGLIYGGSSMISDQNGTILAKGKDREKDVIVVEISL